MDFDIITIGSATRDVFLKIEDFELQKHTDSPTGEEVCLPLGSKLEIKEIISTTGGGGTNTAVTFTRQGLKTACLGVIGNDINGKEIVKELKHENVEPIFQTHNFGQTAYSVILTLPKGERTILSYKGEGQNFDIKQVPFDKLHSKWLFLDSLGGHFSLLENSVNWAVKNNIKLATNPGRKELSHGLGKLAPLFKNFSIIIMNQEEAANLAEISYQKENEIFKFMDNVVDGIFVMTKGPNGVSASDGKNIFRAGVPDSPILERTGAGDAFSSAFIVEYIRSENIEKAIQFATANASSVVTTVGAKEGILKKNDWGPWPLVNVKIEKLA